MNYFNEETAELDGASVWRKMFPINSLPVMDHVPVTRKLHIPKTEFRLQNNLKKNDIEIEVV